MTEDEMGFIWAGTETGLYRIDAKGFKYYKAKPNADYGLSENKITALFSSAKSGLWIGTERKGIVWYDRMHDSFIAIHDNNIYENITPFGFAEDRSGNIWVATTVNKALCCIEPQSKKITYYSLPDWVLKKAGGRVGIGGLSLSISQDGILYLGTTNGLVLFDTKQKRFLDVITFYDKNIYTECTITEVLADADGTVWLAVFGYGLAHYFPQSKKVRLYPLPGSGVRLKLHVMDYSPNHFLVSVHGERLFLFDKNKYSFISLRDVNSLNQEMLGKTECFTPSKEGLLWLGGKFGLLLMDLKNQPGKPIRIKSQYGKELVVNQVIYDSTEKVYYMGLDGAGAYGLLKWDMTNNSFNYYPTVPHPRIGQFIRKIKFDSHGQLWCIDYNFIYRLDKKLNRLIPVYGEAGSEKNIIQDFFIDHLNRIWLSNATGLTLLDSAFHIRGVFQSKGEEGSWTIHAALPAERIWVSNGRLFALFDASIGSFRPYSCDEKRPANIRDIIADETGILWIFKYGIGAYAFNPATGQFRLYGEPEGFASTLFSHETGVYHKGKIWIKVATLLCNINTRSGEIENYDERDLYDLKYMDRDRPVYIDNQDQLIVNSERGIIIAPLAGFIKSRNYPYAFIDGIKVWGHDFYPNKNVNDIHRIDLEHNENYLTLQFSCLSFRQGENNTFSYFLDGYDKEWHTTTTEKQVTYMGLPAGDYTFRLKAANYAGVWDNTMKEMLITIYPAFWQTWWFRCTILLLIVLTIYLSVRLKIRNVRHAADVEMKHGIELMEFELKALKAQINPHFLFNALSAIQQQIFSKNTDDAHRYLGKFANLLRSTLDLSDRRSIQLDDEIELLRNYLEIEKIRFRNKFTYLLEIDESLKSENPEIPGMIIQPYLENAIIHGLLNLDKEREGRLSLHFTSHNRGVQCIIEDNGVGRKKAAEIKEAKGITHESKGMAITGNRIRIISRLYSGRAKAEITDLFDEVGQPRGTRITIELPYIDAE